MTFHDEDVEVFTIDLDRVLIKRAVSRIRMDDQGNEVGRISLGGRWQRVCRHKKRNSWELVAE